MARNERRSWKGRKNEVSSIKGQQAEQKACDFALQRLHHLAPAQGDKDADGEQAPEQVAALVLDKFEVVPGIAGEDGQHEDTEEAQDPELKAVEVGLGAAAK